MLPSRHRLRRSRDLDGLKQSGRSLWHPLVIMVVQRNEGSASRFAFSASRRVGQAVTRNRAKRMLREAVRGQLAEVNAGWNCLLIARRGTAQASSAEVEAGVVHLLLRANIIDAPVDVSTIQQGE